jgi:cell division transport system permease protein
MSVTKIHHRYALKEALLQLVKNPLTSLLMLLLTSLALMLPTLFFMGLSKQTAFSFDAAAEHQLSVYIAPHASPNMIDKVRQGILMVNPSASLQTVTPKEGLTQFLGSSGLESLHFSDNDNPLPTLILVSLKNNADIQRMETLSEKIKVLPAVVDVQFEGQWLVKLATLMHLLNRFGWILSSLAALTIFLMTINTTLLIIHRNKPLIKVLWLIGASDQFIKRPFIYMGILYGLLGGLLTLIGVDILIALIKNPLNYFLALHPDAPTLSLLSFSQILKILLLSLLLTLLGTLGGLSYFLHRMRFERD